MCEAAPLSTLLRLFINRTKKMTRRKTLYVKVPTIDATKDEDTLNQQQDPELKRTTGLRGRRGRSRGRFNQKNKAQTLQTRTTHNQVTSKIQYEVEIVTKIQTSTEATSQQPSTITQKEIITSRISQTSTTESEIIVPNRKIVNLKEVQTLTREEVCSMIHPYLPRDIIQQQFELGLDGTVVFNYLRNKGTDIPPQYTNFVWFGVTVLTEKRLFPFWNEEFTIRKLREKKSLRMSILNLMSMIIFRELLMVFIIMSLYPSSEKNLSFYLQ